MPLKKIALDENTEKLIQKCENKKIDTSVMGACKVLLEEIDREAIDLGEKNPKIEARDVPKILMIAFKIKERPNLEPELKVTARSAD